VQRFVLQENIRLLSDRLKAAPGEDDRRRIRSLLTAVERELARLDADQDQAPAGRQPG
jgi:hypothetical protein